MHLEFLADLADFFSQPEWRMWPFGPGFGQTWGPTIARFAFVSVLLGGIFLFLRVLFGPNGYFRDHELDREAEEMIRKEQKELDRLLEAGEISQAEYNVLTKRLHS